MASSGLANELAVFWESSFGTSFDETRDVLLKFAVEIGHSRDNVGQMLRLIAATEEYQRA